MAVFSRKWAVSLGVLVAIATMLTGCAGDPAERTDPVHDRVVEAFQSTAADLGTVGAFLLVRTPDGEFTSSYGSVSQSDNIEPTVDTEFRIGSNTKTFTGTVILQLVAEGALALDDAVALYRPDVPGGDRITIEMLLTMRSGLYNYTESETWAIAALSDPERVWSPEELLQIAFAGEPVFEPGEGYYYSNTNAVLLGLIAEQLTGKPLEQLFAERLFEPAGLTATRLPAREDVTLNEPFARGYVMLEDDGPVTDATFFNPSWGWSAGAGISTAAELAQWVEVLTTGDLLDAKMQQRRMDSILPLSDDEEWADWGYGLGIAKIAGMLGHNGQLPGYSSFMGSDPNRGVTVVLWANFAPSADGRDSANVLADAVVPLLLNK